MGSTKIATDPEDFSNLSQRQINLVHEYVLCWNKSKAARQAGYPVKSCHTVGPKELQKPQVKRYLAYYTKDIAEKNQEQVAFVIARLREIACVDIKDFLNPDGSLRKLDGKVNGRLIQSIKQSQFGASITLHSAEKALELLGRYLGMWSDKVDVTSNGHSLDGLQIVYQEVIKGLEGKFPGSTLEPGSIVDALGD